MGNFNTSHVSINQISTAIMRYLSIYFNTSHVSINLVLDQNRNFCIVISIHLMFLLISHAFLWHRTVKEFQYISCFY